MITSVPEAGWISKLALLASDGWMKLSLLPLSNRAFAWTPLISTIADDLERAGRLCTEARVGLGFHVAADTLSFVTGFPRLWQNVLSSGSYHK